MEALKKSLGNKDGKIQILRGLAIISVVIIHTYPVGIFGVFLRPFSFAQVCHPLQIQCKGYGLSRLIL